MPEPFDPYYRWLGIGPDEQPADHYRLLGIKRFEDSLEVIETAADRQTAHLRTFKAGPQTETAKKLLAEVAAARMCLLNPTMKAAYDETLAVSTVATTFGSQLVNQTAELPVDPQFELLVAEAEQTTTGYLARLPRRRRKMTWPHIVSGILLLIITVVLTCFAILYCQAIDVMTILAEAREDPASEVPPLDPKITEPGTKSLKPPTELTGTAKKSATLPLLLTLTGHTRPVCSLAFSPDGKMLASGAKDGSVRLWNVTTGQMAWAQPAHAAEVNTVAFSPDGQMIASAGDDRTVQLLSAADGTTIRTIKDHRQGIRSVAFSPDGRLLASAGHGRKIRLWDVDTGKPINAWDTHDDSIMAIDFSPDGKWLASGSLDQSVQLWDPANGQLAQKLVAHEGAVRAVDFVDNTRLVSVGEDGRWILWQVESERPIEVHQDRDDRLLAVAVNPAGSIVAVAGRGAQGVIRLLDTANGKPVTTLPGHEKAIGTLTFSPDGRSLSSGGYDRTIKIWQVDNTAD